MSIDKIRYCVSCGSPLQIWKFPDENAYYGKCIYNQCHKKWLYQESEGFAATETDGVDLFFLSAELLDLQAELILSEFSNDY